jgi:hypothetical protein
MALLPIYLDDDRTSQETPEPPRPVTERDLPLQFQPYRSPVLMDKRAVSTGTSQRRADASDNPRNYW